jgi:hypothetical protein
MFSCRLELYLESSNESSERTPLCDGESPNFAVGHFDDLELWLAHEFRRIAESVPKPEREHITGIVHLRLFTSTVAAWFTISPAMAKVLGMARISLRFVYYAIPAEDSEHTTIESSAT